MSAKRVHPESSAGPPTKKHGGYSDVVGSVSSCVSIEKVRDIPCLARVTDCMYGHGAEGLRAVAY